MSTLSSVTKIVCAAALVYIAVSRIKERERREERNDKFNQAYWDGRLAIAMEDIAAYEKLPIRQFWNDERDATKRRIQCNEFRAKARLAFLNRSEKAFSALERDLSSANFFA